MAQAVHANIDKLMEGRLGAWLSELESVRAAARHKAQWRWTAGAAILMPVISFLWFATGWEGWPFKVALFGGLIVWPWGYQPIRATKQAVKEGINAAVAESLGLSYAPKVKPGAEFDAARAYGLVPRHDRARFEDHWYGMLAGHRFDLYETHLENRERTSNARRWETVFRGVIIAMDYGRAFRSTTLLGQPNDHRTFLGFGEHRDTITLGDHRLERVAQVHPDFEHTFGVWTDDQVEARMLLHPAFIEHLLAVERAFGERLRVLLHEGRLILALESDKLFEGGAMDPETDRARAEQVAGEFATFAELALAINQTERGRVLAFEPSQSP